MTLPRDVRKGVTWLVTRRITRRHFLLRPDVDGATKKLYWYCTAVVAAKMGVVVHCVQVLSDHIHEVLTDTRGNLPRFFELRNRLLANLLKVHRGWPEEVFSSSRASWVELPTPAVMVDKIAYTIANCVAAFLVRSPRQWPGPKVLAEEIGRRVVRARRPDVYIDSEAWPEEVTLRIEMLPQLVEHHGSEEAAREAIEEAVGRKVRGAVAEAKRLGRSFKGVTRVLRTPFTARASSREEFRKRSPTFAAGGDREAAARLVARRRYFQAEYRRCWDRRKEGDLNVVFPYGTWKMKQCYGQPCEPPPD